jgi:PAS domain S-box-containing protein
MTVSTILLPQIVATLILAAVLVFTLRVRDVPEANYFRAAIAIGMVWSLLYGLELNAGLLSDKVLFVRVQFIFLPFISLSYFLMAASHAGKRYWLARRNIMLLAIIPAATVMAMLTSDFTHLFLYDFGLHGVGDFSVLTFSTGPWFWLYTTYSFFLSIMTVVLLVGTGKGARSIYTKQAIVLILGSTIPAIVDMFFILGVSPIRGFNFASSSLMITGVFFSWALFYYHILDIKPVARSEVVDNLSDLYLVIDANDRVVDFNRASGVKLGLCGSKGVGLELRTVLPANAGFYDRLMTRSDFVEELEGIGENDDLIYEASVIGLSEPGSTNNRLLLLRDITQRKRAETALKLSEERYRELLDSSPFPITIASKDSGRLLFINRRAERHFKIGREAALNTMIQDYYEEPGRREQVLKAISEKGHLDDFELVMRDVEGETFWASTSAILVDYQGVKAVFAEYNDISELKRLGAAIQSVNMKMNLLSTITRHDIRNDLMVIHGHIQLAEAETDPGNLKEHLAKIKVASERMDSLIEFTKTYQNLGNELPGWYRVADMFDEAFNQLKAPEITVTVSVGELKIFGDRLVERVFYNLMDNTIRHGGLVSHIELEFHEAGDGAILAYSDDGIGIPESDRSRIFERGFGKNTGLGLFLTREILAITGMTISEKGKEGQGARFEIRIPRNMYRVRSK